MKKEYFGFVVLFLISSAFLSAQATPFIGYDRVAWGVSVNNVRQTYNIGEDIEFILDSDEPNIRFLTQRNVSDSITIREFYFNNWNSNNFRLYRVIVTYGEVDDATHSQLKSLLEQRYGTLTGIDFQEGNTEDTLDALVKHYDSINIFGRFSPEIEVQLIRRRYSRNSWKLDTYIYYTWKRFRDEYQSSKLGL